MMHANNLTLLKQIHIFFMQLILGKMVWVDLCFVLLRNEKLMVG